MTNREIDKLVAEKIMGLPVLSIPTQVYGSVVYRIGTDDYHEPVPSYSADLNAAWTIIEHLRKENKDTAVHIEPVDDSNEHYCTIDMGGRRAQDGANTMPLAICLAALKIKGIEVGEISND